jgi:AraC-like DNA-binding protein
MTCPRSLEYWVKLTNLANFDHTKLAEIRGVTLRTLQRHFRDLEFPPPEKWCKQHRLARAASLLTEGMRIKEVARVLGYRHVSQLSRQFKEQYGVPPALYERFRVILTNA